MARREEALGESGRGTRYPLCRAYAVIPGNVLWYMCMYVSRLDIKSCEMKLQVASLLSTFAVGGLFFFFFFFFFFGFSTLGLVNRPRLVWCQARCLFFEGTLLASTDDRRVSVGSTEYIDSLRQRVRGGGAWWHVGMLGPCTVHAHAHGRMYRRAEVQACRRYSERTRVWMQPD